MSGDSGDKLPGISPGQGRWFSEEVAPEPRVQENTAQASSFSPVEGFQREPSEPVSPRQGVISSAWAATGDQAGTSAAGRTETISLKKESSFYSANVEKSVAPGDSFHSATEAFPRSLTAKGSVFENDLFNDEYQDGTGGDTRESRNGRHSMTVPPVAPMALPMLQINSPRMGSFSSPRPVTPSRLGLSTPQRQASLAERRMERIQSSGRYDRNNISPSRGSFTSQAGMRPSFADSQVYHDAQSQQHSQPLEQSMSLNSVASAQRQGVSLSYDPHGEEHERELEKARSMRVPQSPSTRQVGVSDIANFLLTPGPKNKPVFCYIIRDTSATKMYPKYNLFLEEGKRFLVSSRKRKKQTTTNYLISLDFDDLSRDSDMFFAKLRSNFVGTAFNIYDDGFKMGSKSNRKHSGQPRTEVGAVTYSPNLVGSKAPRDMMAVISAVDGSGRRIFKQTSENDTMLKRVKHGKKLDQLVVMRNKLPRWSEELNAYCLNFNGRVTEASIKNFQLVTEDNEDRIICQFGRIGKNTFTMDYQWPMSALQAFAFCLSSVDNKLACE